MRKMLMSIRHTFCERTLMIQDSGCSLGDVRCTAVVRKQHFFPTPSGCSAREEVVNAEAAANSTFWSPFAPCCYATPTFRLCTAFFPFGILQSLSQRSYSLCASGYPGEIDVMCPASSPKHPRHSSSSKKLRRRLRLSSFRNEAFCAEHCGLTKSRSMARA